MAAKLALAEVPLKRFLDEALIPYEQDEVTRLIIDRHDTRCLRPDQPPDGRRPARLAAA